MASTQARRGPARPPTGVTTESVALPCPDCPEGERFTHQRNLFDGKQVGRDPTHCPRHRDVPVDLQCGRCKREFPFVRVPGAVDPELCPSCGRQQPYTAAGEGERADTDELRVLRTMGAAGGNPVRFRTSRFGNAPLWEGRERAAVRAEEFAAAVVARADPFESVRSLVLWGSFGTMKTDLMHATLRHLIEHGLQPRKRGGVLFIDWRTWFSSVQGTYGRDSAWAVIERAIDADVLLIDDLFSGKITPDAIDLALMVINRREGRPTAASMNLDPVTIESHLATEAISRLGGRGTPDQVRADVARLYSRLSAWRWVESRGVDGRSL